MFAFSAPRESLHSVLGNTHGTVSSIRRDVVSEVHRGVMKTQTMLSEIHARHVEKSARGRWSNEKKFFFGPVHGLSTYFISETCAFSVESSWRGLQINP